MIDRQRFRTFLLGGVAGALLGVLFAPRSGRELRVSITSRVGEVRERGRESYFEAQERLQERMSEARGGYHYVERDSEREAGDAPSGGPAGKPTLRDVSSGVYEEAPVAAGAKAEELRRKVQETRARLRERLEIRGESAGGDDDEG